MDVSDAELGRLLFNQVVKSKKPVIKQAFRWSVRRDLNPRPLTPHDSALPSCATYRRCPLSYWLLLLLQCSRVISLLNCRFFQQFVGLKHTPIMAADRVARGLALARGPENRRRVVLVLGICRNVVRPISQWLFGSWVIQSIRY